jgi:uncharacterized protein YaeQ
MAIKATIYKAHLQIADMDRQLYGDHSATIACHPSETEERMMMRVLAFALHVPQDNHHGNLEFAKGLWDADEPDLWQKDLTGQIVHWLEMGQPDDKRLMRASPRCERVTVYSFTHSTPIWWAGIQTKITRARNLTVWQIPAEQSQALAGLAKRSMQLQVTKQDGNVWVGDGQQSIEVVPHCLYPNHS